MSKRLEVPARVVILGAGYAGLTAYFDLREHMRQRRFSLTLVDKDDYHTFVTRLYTIAGGDESEEDVTLPLRPLVRPPAKLIVGTVTGLDPARRQVQVDGEAVDFDYLIVAVGSEPEYYGVPGAAEYGYFIGTLEAAEQVRERLRQLTGRGRPVRVVVAGAGLTGVEVAGELIDTYRERVHVDLVEAAPEIMPGFEPALARGARQVLERKGVRVHTGRPIGRVLPDTVQLRQPDDPAAAQRFVGHPSELPCDVLIWAGGVRGPALLAEAGLSVNRRGRALVDEYQRSVDDDRIYVIGDASAFVDPESGLELPPTAQAAVQEGRAVARSLLARLQGQPEVAFRPVMRGFFASLGRGAAVGQIGDVQLYGLPAVGLKRLIESHHAWEVGGLAYLLRRSLKHFVSHRGTRAIEEQRPTVMMPDP